MKRTNSPLGTIYRDAGRDRWIARLEAGRDEHGRRRELRATRRTQQAAEQALAGLVARREAERTGQPQAASEGTLAAWLDWWIDNVVAIDRAATTQAVYRRKLRHVQAAIGATPLADLEPGQIQTVIADLVREGKSNTARMARQVLVTALNDAVKYGKLATNPARAVKAPSPVSKVSEHLSLAEAKAVLAAVEGDPLEALYVLALHTGMRNGELLGLRWEHVNLDAGTLHITRRTTKSKSGVRTLYLNDAARHALKLHHEASPGEGYVFTYRGKPIRNNRLGQLWANVTKAAGIKHRQFYVCRHTYATLRLQAGVPLEVISKNLGHSSIGITAQYYADVTDDHRRKQDAEYPSLL